MKAVLNTAGIPISVHCDNSEWMDQANQILKGLQSNIAFSGLETHQHYGLERTTGKPNPTDDTYTEQGYERFFTAARKQETGLRGRLSTADSR
jgi:hypothetical protein